MPRHETTWRTFHIVGGQWVGKARRNRNLRTFWRHEHLSIMMAVAITTHLSSRPRRWLSLGKKAKALTVSSRMLRAKRAGNGSSTLQNVYFTPTGDTFQKAYLEECQWVGDGPKRDPCDNNIQSRSNRKEKQGN